MDNFDVKILDYKQTNSKDKSKKEYYIVRLYISFSACVLDCFVSKDTFNKILNDEINDFNIKTFLHFKVDSDKNFLVSIY